MLKTLRIQKNDAAHSALIMLHGLGSNAKNWRDFALALNLPETVEIILPQAPLRAVTIADGMEIPAWFDIYDRGESIPEDQVGIMTAQQNIQVLVDDLQGRGIHPGNIVIGGFSQGGALALHYACHCRETLAGVMALSSYLPLRHTFAQTPLQKIPVFMSHGKHDDVIPIRYAQMSHDILKQHGFTISWHTYPLGHTLNEQVIKDIGDWLTRISAFTL